MGQELRLECSSDLDARLIELFRNGMKIASSSNSSSISFLHGQVSTDDEGLQYTCRVTSPYAVQEKNITLSVMGKLTSLNRIAFDGSFHSGWLEHCNILILLSMQVVPLWTC